jgi:putative hydrolase of the HAD superfamily
MIKSLIFDIGQVLLRFDFRLALRKMRPFCGVSDMEVALTTIDPIKRRYERGETSRADFLNAVFQVLEYRGSEEQFVSIWEDIFWPNDPMIRVVERVAGRYPLFLLSNTSCIHLPPLFDRFLFFRHFRDGVYSYRAGLEKPDPRIYELAARQFAVRAEETIFIDDLAENVAAAQCFGFIGYHYDFSRHEMFEQWLRGMGISEEKPAK